MRLSDLLGCDVIGDDGRRLGEVRDVRLVQDGPYVEGFGQQLRVEGVLLGKGALGVRVGIARADVKGLWPLTTVFRRLEHRARFVAWTDVSSRDDRQLHLKPGARLVPVDELDQVEE